MAAGAPITLRNAARKGGAVANLTVVATSGDLPTANGSVTVADATTPTVAELLEFCVELETKLEALLAALRTNGILES